MSPLVTSQTPPETAALAQRARRALFLSHWLDLVVRSMPWALGMALLVVIGVRWLMEPDWWWGIPAGLVVLAIGWTGVVAWLRRPDQLAAAGWVDESIHSQSRYRSALELASASNTDPAFASIAVASAEQSAKEIELPNNQHSPWYTRSQTSTCSFLLVFIIAAGLYMPSRSPKPTKSQPSPTAIADAREQIELQQQELQDITEQVQVDDPLIDDALQDLAALEEELTNPESTPDPESTAARAASRVEQLADQLDQRSQEQRLKDQALRQQLDKLKSESLSKDSDLDRFREQLSEGRYEEAIDELDALDEALDSMSPQERQQAAKDLESLANAIKPENTQEPPQTDSPQNTPVEDQPDTEQLTKDLADALKEKADRITEPTPPSPPQPPQPQPESQQDQQPEPQPDPSEPDQQPDQQQSDQKPSDQSQDNQDQSQFDSQPEQKPEQKPGQEPGQKPEQQPGQDQSPSDQPAQDPSQQPSNQGDQQEQPSQQPSKKPGTEPDQNQQQDGQQGDQQNDQQGDTESNQPQPQPQPQPSSEPDAQQRPQPSDKESDKESDQPSEKESTQQGDEQGDEGQSTLKEILKDAQRQSEGAQRDRTMAERLREQLEPTPQQPEGSEQVPSPSDEQIDQQDNEQSSPYGNDQPLSNQSTEPPSETQEYVPVQAADENAQADDSSNPLGKWYNPDQDRPNPTGQSTQSTSTAQRFRQAAKQAREQVDDRRVPRRYRDVISKYFKQLDQRASNIAPSSVPSSDGTDAPNPKPKTDNITP